MRPDVGGVDGVGVTGPAGLGQRSQHRLPDTALGPTVEAVVDRGGRTVLRRIIAPAAARLHDVEDARNDLTVVGAFGARLVLRHEGFDHHPLLVRQLEQVRHGVPSCLKARCQSRISVTNQWPDRALTLEALSLADLAATLPPLFSPVTSCHLDPTRAPLLLPDRLATTLGGDPFRPREGAA